MLNVKKIISAILLVVFLLTTIVPPQYSSAQMVLTTQPAIFTLPPPGEMIGLTDAFNPLLVKGVKLYPEDPFRLDFIIDTGDSDFLSEELKVETNRLIKYFLASLTVPDEEMWVNLSPYEKDRIVPDAFGVTEMGRDLLAQDYILKQLSASLMYPEDELGHAFWEKIKIQALEKFGMSEIPTNVFHKVWIVPQAAAIYENDNRAFVSKSVLKVMMESDYLASRQNSKNVIADAEQTDKDQMTEDLIKEIIIPAIEEEVNTGQTFATLRQIYHSLILATWFKRKVQRSLLGEIYVGKKLVDGVDVADKQVKFKIYQQYLEAFQTGVFDYIAEEYDPRTQAIIPRKYFSGGTDLMDVNHLLDVSSTPSSVEDINPDQAMMVAVKLNQQNIGNFTTNVAGQLTGLIEGALEQEGHAGDQAMVAGGKLSGFKTPVSDLYAKQVQSAIVKLSEVEALKSKYDDLVGFIEKALDVKVESVQALVEHCLTMVNLSSFQEYFEVNDRTASKMITANDFKTFEINVFADNSVVLISPKSIRDFIALRDKINEEAQEEHDQEYKFLPKKYLWDWHTLKDLERIFYFIPKSFFSTLRGHMWTFSAEQNIGLGKILNYIPQAEVERIKQSIVNVIIRDDNFAMLKKYGWIEKTVRKSDIVYNDDLIDMISELYEELVTSLDFAKQNGYDRNAKDRQLRSLVNGKRDSFNLNFFGEKSRYYIPQVRKNPQRSSKHFEGLLRKPIIEMQENDPQQYQKIVKFIQDAGWGNPQDVEQVIYLISVMHTYETYAEYLGITPVTAKKVVENNGLEACDIKINDAFSVTVISPKGLKKVDGIREEVLNEVREQYKLRFEEDLELRFVEDLEAWESKKSLTEIIPSLSESAVARMTDLWSYKNTTSNVGISKSTRFVPPIEVDRLKKIVIDGFLLEGNFEKLQQYRMIAKDAKIEDITFEQVVNLIQQIKTSDSWRKAKAIEGQVDYSATVVGKELRSGKMGSINLNFFGERADRYVHKDGTRIVESDIRNRLEAARDFLKNRCAYQAKSLNEVPEKINELALTQQPFVEILGARDLPSFKDLEETQALQVAAGMRSRLYISIKEAKAIYKTENQKFKKLQFEVFIRSGKIVKTKEDLVSYLVESTDWVSQADLDASKGYWDGRRLSQKNQQINSVTMNLLGFGRLRTYVYLGESSLIAAYKDIGDDIRNNNINEDFVDFFGLKDAGIEFMGEMLSVYLNLEQDKLGQANLELDNAEEILRQWSHLKVSSLVNKIISHIQNKYRHDFTFVIQEMTKVSISIENYYNKNIRSADWTALQRRKIELLSGLFRIYISKCQKAKTMSELYGEVNKKFSLQDIFFMDIFLRDRKGLIATISRYERVKATLDAVQFLGLKYNEKKILVVSPNEEKDQEWKDHLWRYFGRNAVVDTVRGGEKKRILKRSHNDILINSREVVIVRETDLNNKQLRQLTAFEPDIIIVDGLSGYTPGTQKSAVLDVKQFNGARKIVLIPQNKLQENSELLADLFRWLRPDSKELIDTLENVFLQGSNGDEIKTSLINEISPFLDRGSFFRGVVKEQEVGIYYFDMISEIQKKIESSFAQPLSFEEKLALVHIESENDQAILAKDTAVGGIDLNLSDMPIDVDGDVMSFDQGAMIEGFEGFSGLLPVIISIEPLSASTTFLNF